MKIPYGRQFIDNVDINAVSKALKEDKITTGKHVINFENKIRKYLSCNYASVCNSGTSALFLALRAIEIKENDVIIMPSVNFIASYNIAKLFNAKIYLADTNKITGQMSPRDVENCCIKFNLRNVKAIIPMYLGGYPNDVEKFFKFKKKYGSYIIEDACHAFGASYKFKKKFYKIGSCKHADISTFSFHPLKTITTGEGGLVTTNDKSLNDKIKKIRSHGILRFKNKHWKYDVLYEGLNFRLTDFQSALGISQLKKINKFINARKKIFNFYNKKLESNDEIICPKLSKNCKGSYHLYFFNLKRSNLKKKENFIKYMLKKQIMIQHHYTPIFKFKIFKDKYIGINSNKYFNSSVSLPIFYELKKREQVYIINLIKKFFKNK